MDINLESLKKMANNGYGTWIEKNLPQMERDLILKQCDIRETKKKLRWLESSAIKDNEQLEEHREELRIIGSWSNDNV